MKEGRAIVAAGAVEQGGSSLAAKVAFLRRPESYPEPPSRVEMVETHMSCVFLTDRYAYKLKKPVRLDSLDYATVEARRHFCHEEVRLNRRLARGVYLDALPLTAERSGRLRIGGAGKVVDWLVRMRRLPEAARLDTLILEQAVEERPLADALAAVAAFYCEASPIGFRRDEYRLRLQRAVERNRRALAPAAAHLPPGTERIIRDQLELVERPDGPLAARASRVIEAHGDLRPEHVYLLDPPVIVDRLDFDRDLRLLDPVDELAFLALESDRLGAAGVEKVAFDVYERLSGDTPPPAVVAFYRSLRACMRARLALGHLADPAAAERSRWHDVATGYLELAGAAVPSFVARPYY